jgi:hypothetical protein
MRWEIELTAGWFTPPGGAFGHCSLFSPAPIELAPATDFGLEIDLVVAPAALRRGGLRLDQGG